MSRPRIAFPLAGFLVAAALMAVDRWRSVRGVVLESVYARFEEAVRTRVRVRLGYLEPLL